MVAVIGTGKRTGKTALGTHLAALLRDRGAGAGGRLDGARRAARAGRRAGRASGPDVERLLEIARAGGHAASDYLEDAVLAGVTTVGCRRCGEGPAGETFESNVLEGLRARAARAARRRGARGQRRGAAAGARARDRLRDARGAGAGAQALSHLGPLRLLRADLLVVLGAAELVPPARDAARGRASRAGSRRSGSCAARCGPSPRTPLPQAARVACFVTARPGAEAEPAGRARSGTGVEPRVLLHQPGAARRPRARRGGGRARGLRRVPHRAEGGGDRRRRRGRRARRAPGRVPAQPARSPRRASAPLDEVAARAGRSRPRASRRARSWRRGRELGLGPAPRTRPRSSCAATTGCPTPRA